MANRTRKPKTELMIPYLPPPGMILVPEDQVPNQTAKIVIPLLARLGKWALAIVIGLLVIGSLGSCLLGFLAYPAVSSQFAPTQTYVPTFTLTLVPTLTQTPTQTRTSTVVPCEPCDAVRGYYALLSEGNFGAAWKTLTQRFQNRKYNGIYDDYFDEVWKDGPIAIVSLEREPDDNEFPVVYVVLRYKRTEITAPYRLWLVWETGEGRWKIDNLEYVSLMK